MVQHRVVLGKGYSGVTMLNVKKVEVNDSLKRLCEEFAFAERPKYILGRNERANAVGNLISVDGFIDDFTKEVSYQGKPILRAKNLPSDALVLITSICNPFSAQKSISGHGLEAIDYFSFLKYSDLPIPDIEFQPDFAAEFENNKHKYELIYERLCDEESKKQFQKILNFRLNRDLKFMDGFINNEKNQYFEAFLDLKIDGEIFIDAGGFDGYTTQEFIKRCSNFKSIHIFEPEAENLGKAKNNLKKYPSIEFHPYGLYSKKTSFRFATGGSASRISEQGEIEIKVDALDNVVDAPVTFIKMDIEGAEIEAIKGAESLIRTHKPRLAISAYHRADDFWKIPETVWSIRSDYKIYMRHYMEGVTETVMFFV